ncbi:MAG TPA: glycosyltransferase family 4 protein [bacterium]|nr:glycosyltransferase family 4 protein [bacterium]
MKILYFANSRIPTEKAYGLQIMKTCEALAENGVSVDLILPTRKNRPFKGIDVFEYYGVKKNFEIKRILSHDPNWLMILPNGIFIKAQIFFFSLSLFLFLFFKQSKKDFIFYTRDEYLLPILLNFSKKVFWEAHTLPRNGKHYLKFWHKCVGIVAITEGLKKDLIKLGLEENKIMVAPDGVDLKNFELRIKNYELRARFNLPADKKIVMYTGHLYDWKGTQTLAEAAEFLNDDAIVVFIGGTDFDLKNFKNKNRELIEKGKILLLGQRPPREIPEFLAVADCLILPNSGKENRSEKYTSPMKMFEYLAAGKPIVASNLPSIKEILNQDNAVLVEADKPEEFARGIVKVLTDDPECSGLAQKISAQAKEDSKKYSWLKRVEKILNFIR